MFIGPPPLLWVMTFYACNRGRQRQPYVLCGTNSRRIVMDDVRNSRTSVNSEISKCGINNESPKFMVGLSQTGLSTRLKQILSENISLL